MATQDTIIQDNNSKSKSDRAIEAIEAWRQQTAQNRGELLQSVSERLALLTGNTTKAMRLFNHLLEQTSKLDDVMYLQGATGESNELYLSARGKTLVMGTPNAHSLPVLGQLLAALLTGNEVILHYPDQRQICKEAVSILHKAGVSDAVLSVDNEPTADLLYLYRLAQVAITGSLHEVQVISAKLAKTEGILTQVIPVTDVDGCREMLEPDYLYRFITERVKTVNTTAIGGNASLLELDVGGTERINETENMAY